MSVHYKQLCAPQEREKEGERERERNRKRLISMRGNLCATKHTVQWGRRAVEKLKELREKYNLSQQTAMNSIREEIEVIFIF